MSSPLKPWIEACQLNPDVLSDDFSEDVFALDLGPLADGRPNVPAVYRDPEHFFGVSQLTAGLRSLLNDVLSRIAGGTGSRVLKLVTPFGGGKSHTLAALLHAARSRAALDRADFGLELPRPEGTRIAVFDGAFFDATNGKEMPGTNVRAKTMWGWIAWSLGGAQGYELLRQQDEARVAPGADVILDLLSDSPNLILLDEVLQYLISAGGIKVSQTTLRDETVTFLQRLTTAVSNTKKTALAFTLQSSKRESLEYVGLLQTVDHLAARKDQLREPVEGNEILQVIQRRLLSKLSDLGNSTATATAYQETVSQMRRAYAKTNAEQEQADVEGLKLRDRIRSSYPFHPALIDLMRERWAAIPDFQRTRGALRFLAACLRAAHRSGRSRYLLGPGDVPLEDAEVRLAFFKEVGQQADFQAVLEHDFIGANARSRLIDERRAKEVPADAIRRPATRLATAILMYSFGGLRREGTAEGELLPPGITEAELLSVCVGPDLDSTTAQACLKELKEQCLYLHFDGARYCFKKDPNVTLLVEQEADTVARDDKRARARIREMLEERLAGHHDAIVWPEKPSEVPDEQPTFLLAYLPLEFTRAAQSRESAALEFFERYGDKPRKYRNGVALVVPALEQIESLYRAVRYLLAIEQVKAKAKQLNITDEQRSQLREREATEAAGVEASLLRLYSEVWFPKGEAGAVSIERIAAGGRPLQTTVNQKKQAMIHERVIELITAVQPRVFSSVKPSKIVELFRMGEGEPATVGLSASDVVNGFFSFLGFTRLTSSVAIQRAIAKGVEEGIFGYYLGSVPRIAPDGKYEIPRDRVRFGVPVLDDEVDLESGFLIWPSALPLERELEGDQSRTAVASSSAVLSPAPDSEVASPSLPLKAPIEVSFTAGRNQLFEAWNAIANLADICGTVAVTVRGEPDALIDRTRVQNGVIEPLQEAGLID
jgi:hypothetical protein